MRPKPIFDKLPPFACRNGFEVHPSFDCLGHEEVPEQMVVEWGQPGSLAGIADGFLCRANRDDALVQVRLFAQVGFQSSKQSAQRWEQGNRTGFMVLGALGTTHLKCSGSERGGLDVLNFYVLKGRITENRFAAVRVNEDNWKIDFCPMCGPELTFAEGGQSLCAFMSRNRVYWAVAGSPGSSFRLHVATPANEESEIYPTAVANRNGDVLLVWQVGPMATKGTATVKWSRYDKNGNFTGKAGIVGKSFAGTKATAFVGSDDRFYLVTTAQP